MAALDVPEIDLREVDDTEAVGKRTAIYVKDGVRDDGSTVNFIDLILDGLKRGETRIHKRFA